MFFTKNYEFEKYLVDLGSGVVTFLEDLDALGLESLLDQLLDGFLVGVGLDEDKSGVHWGSGHLEKRKTILFDVFETIHTFVTFLREKIQLWKKRMDQSKINTDSCIQTNE